MLKATITNKNVSITTTKRPLELVESKHLIYVMDVKEQAVTTM